LFLTLGKVLTDKSVMVRVALATAAGQLLVLITRPEEGGFVDDDNRSR